MGLLHNIGHVINCLHSDTFVGHALPSIPSVVVHLLAQLPVEPTQLLHVTVDFGYAALYVGSDCGVLLLVERVKLLFNVVLMQLALIDGLGLLEAHDIAGLLATEEDFPITSHHQDLQLLELAPLSHRASWHALIQFPHSCLALLGCPVPPYSCAVILLLLLGQVFVLRLRQLRR